MLDLQPIDPAEPFDLDDYVIFSDLSTVNSFFGEAMYRFSTRIKQESLITILNHSVSFRDGANLAEDRSYVGDFYLVGEQCVQDSWPDKWLTEQNAAELAQKLVRPWRYRYRDVIFHLERFSYKEVKRWYHFVMTNNPNRFSQRNIHRQLIAP